jgi:hypothetical protein
MTYLNGKIWIISKRVGDDLRIPGFEDSRVQVKYLGTAKN